MFVGYLRADFEESCTPLVQHNTLFDLQLLRQTHKRFPQYCFAAYEQREIVGVLSAYRFKSYIYVNVLEVIDAQSHIIKRLLDLLLKNVASCNVLCLMSKAVYNTLQKDFSFKVYHEFIRYMHSAQAVAFNFSNSLAKQVTSNDYESISTQIDTKVFNENRKTYLSEDAAFSNSLKLATPNGFLHSYVINKRYIRISPWLMIPEAFMDAEKLLRGVLYYRGLKKIFAYVPNNIQEVMNLYESYKFENDGDYVLVYLNEKPCFTLEEMYAL
jgi:hypothetical protein